MGMKAATVLATALGLAQIPAQAFAQDIVQPGAVPGGDLPPVEPQQGDDGRLIYEAAFFTRYSPANALQVVQRVPGFTVESGSTEVRGFASAAGNVVINGQRPSSKSDSLDTVLARIPATRVLRVELAPGSEFGSDYVGKPQVVNLILTEQGGLDGTLQGRLSREYTGRILPRASAAIVYRTGTDTFSGSFSHEIFNMTSEEGYDRLIALPSRQELRWTDRTSRNTEPFTNAALGWAREDAPDQSMHLNAKLSLDKWTLRQEGLVQVGGVHVGNELYREDHLWRTGELSGDITRPLAGGAIKLNALATHRHRRNDDWFDRAADGMAQGGFYQDFDDYRDERVARLAWSHGGLGGWTAEVGAEGAFNRLETDLNVFDIDATGIETIVALPIDDAVVTEYRGEGFVNGGRALASNLRIDLGMNFEFSRLRVTGDVSARRSLKFLKPKATLDWTPGGWHFQLSTRRTVAQLRFEDFVSGSSFNTGQVSGGNAELQPQRRWEFLFSADRPILRDGRAKIDLGYNAVSMVQDRIPLKILDPLTGELVNSGLDAPGNLGSGTEFLVRANLDLPLAGFGLRGARLSLNGSYLDSSVIDPYTFFDRHFSGTSLFVYSATFRQDLSTFAWGVELRGDTGSTSYRLNELDRTKGIAPRLNAFAEYRHSVRTTFTLGAENFIDGRAQRWRTFYRPDRTSLEPYQEEFRARTPHVQFYLLAKHSFG
jgi:hypothetical protein